jgi:hypothetical protein
MDDPQRDAAPDPQSAYSSYLTTDDGPQTADGGPSTGDGTSIASPAMGSGDRQRMVIGAIVAAVLIALLVVLALRGDLGQFLQIGILFVPLAALAALAYAGQKNITAMVFAYIVLALTGAGVVLYSLATLLLGYVIDWDAFNSVVSSGGLVGRSDLQGVFDPSAGAGLLLALLLFFVATLLTAAMLFRPVRVLVSKIIPIDPDNFVHKIALSILTLILFSCFIPLIVLDGKPPLLNLVEGSGTTIGGQSIGVQPLDLVYQFIWTIPATFVAAGWPVARRFPAMLKRLGLVRPTTTQVVFGLVFGLVLAVAAAFVIDPGITWLWHTLGWETTNTAAFDKLLSSLVTPVGAVLIGVTAGLGEELAVRGLLQPRIGLVASNLVFTGFHAFQYGLDGLLSVFIIGMILGVVRARTNTTTSAIVHGTYDFTLVLAQAIFS